MEEPQPADTFAVDVSETEKAMTDFLLESDYPATAMHELTTATDGELLAGEDVVMTPTEVVTQTVSSVPTEEVMESSDVNVKTENGEKPSRRRFERVKKAESKEVTCEVCQVSFHQAQYEEHINGQKHRKTAARKEREAYLGSASTSSETVKPRVNEGPRPELHPDPRTKAIIDESTVPLLGLSDVTEVQCVDTTRNPYYYCHLCNIKLEFAVIVSHLSGARHRKRYVQQYNATYKKELGKIRQKHEWNEAMEKFVQLLYAETGNGTMLIDREDFFVLPEDAILPKGENINSQGKREMSQESGPSSKRGRSVMEQGYGDHPSMGGYSPGAHMGRQMGDMQPMTLSDVMRKCVHLLDNYPICTDDEASIAMQLTGQLDTAIIKYKTRVDSSMKRIIKMGSGITTGGGGGGRNGRRNRGGGGGGYHDNSSFGHQDSQSIPSMYQGASKHDNPMYGGFYGSNDQY